MLPRLSLSAIDFRDGREVIPLLRELHSMAFPGADDLYIDEFVNDVEMMFQGRMPGYQAMDTAYHDLGHTLQATLCWARLIVQRNLAGAQPGVTPAQFRTGLIAILMHDIGYLKEAGDTDGTGAKFTFVHERRSCEMALEHLLAKGWPLREIFTVQHLISCTGPLTLIDSIPFYGPDDRLLGQSVCTADYLGQMSDPAYVAKLRALFNEFCESDDHRGIPPQKRLFRSYDQLIRQTPAFWDVVVKDKLENECGALHRYLTNPYPDGRNDYLDAVEANIAKVRKMVLAQTSA